MSVTYIYSAKGKPDKNRDRVFNTPEEGMKMVRKMLFS
jgi:hypothetical protein